VSRPLLAPTRGDVSGASYVEFNDRPHGGHRKLLDLVPSGSRVLDVGCSAGYLAERLVAKGCTVTGVELDPEAAAEARRFCAEVVVGDVERMELPFEPASFDVIACGDLVEHLRDPGAFLARVRPLLRPGGRLILTTPNVANWSIRLLLLLGRFDYTERGILDRTHTHLFTRRTLVATLRGAGLEPEVVDFTVPLPVAQTERNEAIAYRIGRLRPTLFAFQWVVAARPSGS
jgi:2-polyprenyl-3-methyl-5-hydroxy-6-metoxy-1,4-benzoquinol methylase